MKKRASDTPKQCKPMRVAVIGCTKAAEAHIEALGAVSGVKLVALCDAEVKKVKAFQKKYKVRRRYTNYLKMIESCFGRSIDAVHVCLDDAACALVASYCLMNKCHVMTVYPMALDLAAVKDAVKNADYMGKNCAIVPPACFDGAATFAKEALATGNLGAILSARSVISAPAITVEESDKGFSAEKPDRLLFDSVAPAINFVDSLIEADVASLSCSLSNRAHTDKSLADSAEGVVTYEGNVKHSFYCTANYESGNSIQITLACEKGSIVFEGAQVRITYEDGTESDMTDESAAGYSALIGEFYEACREGRAPVTDAHGALRLHEILLGLYADAMERGVEGLSAKGAASSFARSKKIWY